MAAIKEAVFNCSAICLVTIVRYTTTSTMDRANYKERSQEVSKELERTDDIVWGEEDDSWMSEIDDFWMMEADDSDDSSFTKVVMAFDIVETILEEILNKVCAMS